jgi:hypothetical protein
MLKSKSPIAIDLGGKIKKKKIFKDKGLIVRFQSFKGEIENAHFLAQNGVVPKATIHLNNGFG